MNCMRPGVEMDEVVGPEDVWVRGWEFRAGNNGDRVHHFCTGVILPGEDVAPVSPGGDDEASIRSSLGCMAAGAESTMLPEGFGLLVPKGSTVTVGMHYNKEPGPGTAFRNRGRDGTSPSPHGRVWRVRFLSRRTSGIAVRLALLDAWLGSDRQRRSRGHASGNGGAMGSSRCHQILAAGPDQCGERRAAGNRLALELGR